MWLTLIVHVLFVSMVFSLTLGNDRDNNGRRVLQSIAVEDTQRQLSDCAYENCPAEASACEENEGCIEFEQCMLGCDLDALNNCVNWCIQGQGLTDRLSRSLHRSLLNCANPAGCYDLEEESTNTAPAISTDSVLLNVAYSNLDERNVLDLYHTTSPSGARNPLFIYIHGGGWQGGSKDRVNSKIMALLDRGFSIASIEYRLSDHAFPAPISDVKAAVRFLRANAATYNLDPNRFVASGPSAGGHLAAMLGTSIGVDLFDDALLGNEGVSSAVQLVVDFYGPSDIGNMDADANENECTNPLVHGEEGSPESNLLDCVPSTCPDRAAEASPVTHADGNEPPFLIFHGTEDCTVATPQSDSLHQALQAVGSSSTYIKVTGAGHNLNQVLTDQNTEIMYNFLESHMMAKNGRRNNGRRGLHLDVVEETQAIQQLLERRQPSRLLNLIHELE